MQQIEINGQQYLCVEVPEGAKDFEMLMHQIWGLIPPNQGRTRLKILPAGNYEVVGLVKDLRYRHPADAVGIESTLIHFNLTDNTLILKIKENE